MVEKKKRNIGKIILFIIFGIILLWIGEFIIINPSIRELCSTGEPFNIGCDNELVKILTYYPTHLIKRALCILSGSGDYNYISSFFAEGSFRCLPKLVAPLIAD